MTRIRELHRQWMDEPGYRAEYERLGPEFELARTLIEARSRADLTQEEVARRMNMKQSTIARWEAGRMPSTKALQQFARATGTHLRISLES